MTMQTRAHQLANDVIERYSVPAQDAAFLLTAVNTTWQTFLPECQHCGAQLAERPVKSHFLGRELPLFDRCDCGGAQAERDAAERRRLGPKTELRADGMYEDGRKTHEQRGGVWVELGNMEQRSRCIPPLPRQATWSHFKRTGTHGSSIRTLIQWTARAVAGDGEWLYMHGDNGCGKTSALGCIGKDLLATGRSVMWLDWSDFITASFERIDALIEAASAVDVLLIDEIGKGKMNEYTAPRAAALVNRRYNHLALTVFATNFDLDKLCDALGNDGIAIADRIRFRSKTVDMNGISYRTKS